MAHRVPLTDVTRQHTNSQSRANAIAGRRPTEQDDQGNKPQGQRAQSTIGVQMGPRINMSGLPARPPLPFQHHHNPLQQQQYQYGNGNRWIFEPSNQPLGSGAYGTVYPAYDRILNREVAIKIIKPQSQGALLCPTTIREIGLLKSVRHENIVDLLAMSHVSRQSVIYLVFERAQYDLKKFWSKFYKENNFGLRRRERHIDLDLVKHIMVQIIRAVSFLHSIKIIHRDLKPQNILLFVSRSSACRRGIYYRVKIADFGLARGHNQPNLSLTTEVVTLWYRPIELLLGCKRYGDSVDVWAIGCVLYELITNQPLFSATSQIETIMKIFQFRFPFLFLFVFYIVCFMLTISCHSVVGGTFVFVSI